MYRQPALVPTVYRAPGSQQLTCNSESQTWKLYSQMSSSLLVAKLFIALSVSSSDLATNSWCLILGSRGTSQAVFRCTQGVPRTHLAPRFGPGLWAFTRQTFTGKLSPCSTTSECYLREFYPKFKASFQQHLNSDKSVTGSKCT